MKKTGGLSLRAELLYFASGILVVVGVFGTAQGQGDQALQVAAIREGVSAITAKQIIQTAEGATTDDKTRKPAKAGNEQAVQPSMQVRVYLADEQRIEIVELEDYVAGVVVAEMGTGFEPAALEAQALAARTYIVRRLLAGNRDGVPDKGANVTDTVTHQVYFSIEKMKLLHEQNPEGWRKVWKAAENTRNLVLSVGEEPIDALYFASSNGYTENVEEVFAGTQTYLRSVKSPWEMTLDSELEAKVTLRWDELCEKLGINAADAREIRIIDYTNGRRVKQVKVGESVIAGTQFRAKLGLRSTAFRVELDGDLVEITTMGYGHGVGMSQWGAQGMAMAGFTAAEIVKYYYSGVELMEVSKLAKSTSTRV